MTFSNTKQANDPIEHDLVLGGRRAMDDLPSFSRNQKRGLWACFALFVFAMIVGFAPGLSANAARAVISAVLEHPVISGYAIVIIASLAGMLWLENAFLPALVLVIALYSAVTLVTTLSWFGYFAHVPLSLSEGVSIAPLGGAIVILVGFMLIFLLLDELDKVLALSDRVLVYLLAAVPVQAVLFAVVWCVSLVVGPTAHSGESTDCHVESVMSCRPSSGMVDSAGDPATGYR